MIVLLVFAAGCRSQRGQDPSTIPTPASLNALATFAPLTQNAPPPPYNLNVAQFATIDAGLNTLTGAHYIAQLQFDGVYAGTTRDADASARLEVFLNQLPSSRRLLFSRTGALADGDTPTSTPAPTIARTGTPNPATAIAEAAASIANASGADFEAVQLGNDAYLIRGETCLTGNDAATATRLSASAFVGGVTLAQPAGRQAVINGETVYAYAVEDEALLLPAVRVGDGGSLTIESYELWIAPARGAVVRYYLNLQLENATLLGQTTPVSGALYLRYDADQLGTSYNLTVPFGC